MVSSAPLWTGALSVCLSRDLILLCLEALQHTLHWNSPANPSRSGLSHIITFIFLGYLWIFPFSYFITMLHLYLPETLWVRIPTDPPCQDWLDTLVIFMAVFLFNLIFLFAPFNYFWWLSTPRDINPPGKWDQVHTTFAEGNICSLHEYAMWFKHKLYIPLKYSIILNCSGWLR